MKSALFRFFASCVIALLASLPAGAQTHPAPGIEEPAEEGAFRRSAQEKYEEGLAKRYGTRDLSELFSRAARSRLAEVEREETARGGRGGLGVGPLAAPVWSTLGPTVRTHRLPSVQSDDSGLVSGVAVNPSDRNVIFIASAGGGVWRTKDAGTTWSLVTADVGILQMGAVAIAPSQPNRVYAGTGCADASSFRLGNARSAGYPLRVGVGILISNDGGDTWRVGTSSPASYFWQILVDPQSPDTLLAAGDRGVQRSTDGGDSWAPVLFGEATPFATRLVRSSSQPSTVLAATWGPSLPGSIFKSTDSGVTWAEKVSGLPGDATTRGRIEIALSPTDGQRVYALIDGYGAQLDVARSSDGGETWQGTNIGSKAPTNAPSATVDILKNQGTFCNVMAVDPGSPNTVYAGGTDLWKTTDGGDSWTWLTDWKGTERTYLHADLHVLEFGSDGTLFVGNDGGLYSSSDGGTSFKALNKSTLSFLVSGLCQDPANPDRISVGAQDNGNSFRTSGTEWRETTTGDGFGCTFHLTDPSFIFASTQNQGIQRSTDGGQTFRRSVSGLTEASTKDASFSTIVLGSPSGPFRVYTHTKRKIWVSADNGDSWAQLSQEMPVIDDISDFSISRTDGNRMVLLDRKGQVVVSSDGGVNWTKAGDAPGLFRSRVRLDRADPNKIYVASSDPRSERQRVWVTTNGGAAWTALSNTGQPTGLPDLPINAFETDTQEANVLWAGSFIGLYRSGDGGQTWARFGQGLPNVPVMDIQPLN
ncbi:MAG: hypothetical protein ABIQ65_17920, partial [Thermoanaerobaculia bacterium]